MELTLDQIEILLSDANPDQWIKEAREESELLKMHFYGTGLTEHLTKVQGLENDAQIKLRKKYAISNASLIDSLLRPVDNAWSAKGGSVNVDASNETKNSLTEKIKDSNNGMSVKEYMRDIWSDRFITDPNGLLFMEVSEDGEKTYPTYKSIFDINKMRISGIRPDYVVFEPEVELEDRGIGNVEKSKTYWVVDDAFYRLIEKTGESIVVKKEIVNSFGRVPAIQNSPIVDTERRIKISPIDKQLGLLDSYLIDNSINNIYKKLHGYPVFWFYTGKCDSCKGSGEVQGVTCTSCNGTKQSMKRDVSDGIPLATPKDADAPTIAPNIAGYIQPDLETWREQRNELEHLFNLIYFSTWGTTIERQDRETATGRFIDAQPIINRLNRFSDVFERIHKELLELYTEFYYPTANIGVFVSYGRRYLIETPDQIWKKYTETLKSGADDSTKDLQLRQFYEAEFQSDEIMRQYFLKLIEVEPLVHYSVIQVMDMELSEDIKNMKLAFTSWKHTKTIGEIIDSSREDLIEQLKQFTDEKSSKQDAQVQGAEV